MKIVSGFRIVALLSALAGAGAPLSAQVADFESKPAFSCSFEPGVTDGGLSFAHSFAACFYSPAEPADWPFAPSSTIMGIGFSPITMTRVDDSLFSFVSADLSAGVFATPGTILVTGFMSGGGIVTRNVDLGFGFQTYDFNWANLTSVVFSELPPDIDGFTGYIGFDNVTYATNVVPEPATAALMIPGIALAGFLSRRRRQRAS